MTALRRAIRHGIAFSRRPRPMAPAAARHCQTARMATQYGPYGPAKRPVLHCKTGRFANHLAHNELCKQRPTPRHFAKNASNNHHRCCRAGAGTGLRRGLMHGVPRPGGKQHNGKVGKAAGKHQASVSPYCRQAFILLHPCLCPTASVRRRQAGARGHHGHRAQKRAAGRGRRHSLPPFPTHASHPAAPPKGHGPCTGRAIVTSHIRQSR